MTRLLNKKEAAEYLNVKVRTIDYFRERRNLPFHIIGGKLVRFDERELEQWALGQNAGASSGADEQMKGGDNGAE